MSDITIPDPEWEGLLARVDTDPESIGADEGRILGIEDATRAMRQRARLDAHAEAVDAAVRAEVQRLTAWAEDQHDRQRVQREFLDGRLLAFHAARLAEDPKAITIRLPHGDLTSRLGQPTWTFTDEFLAWAKDNRPDLVDYPTPPPPRPDRNAVKKAFKGRVKDGMPVTEDGEVVPGVTVEPAQRKFTIAPDLTRDGAR